MLEFRDKYYFDECVNDQTTLLVPVTIRRTVGFEPKENYPDAPLVPIFSYINIQADIREASYPEIDHSGGVLIQGDLIMWTREYIKGPGVGDLSDPLTVADTMLLFGEEFVIIGFPMRGRIKDSLIGGYETPIRKRVATNAPNTNTSY